MSTTPTVMSLRVAVAEPAARGIQRFELRHPEGAELPAFTAGAHIRIKTPSGAMRQYSLSNDPAERDRYVIAVKREGDGRGGSLSLVDGVRAGQMLEVGEPENLFELDSKARSFVLIAGGIGITPMMAMARHLLAEGERSFKLYYLTRDPEGTAFLDELRGPDFAPHVVMHHDGGNPANTFDLWPVLERPGSATGRHVYCCGPQPLMDAIRHAGSVFLGRMTPEAVGDYVAGPNHVLPTGRRARFSSGLSVLDFMKRTSFIQLDEAGLKAIGPAAVAMAEAEGLPAHARSVEVRF